MAKEAIDYKAVIDDLEVKRATMNAGFDAAISAIQQIMTFNGADVQPKLPGLRSLPLAQTVGAPYREMGIVDAALKHLAIVKYPVPNLKLAAALEVGGFKHKSKNFPNTLNSVLWRRSKTIGDLRKSARGWETVDRGVAQKQSNSE